MWNGFLGCLGKKDIYVGCIFFGCCGVLIFGCGKQYFIFERNMNGVVFKVEIPVDPYLKKYLLKKLGHEPYVLSSKNHIGRVLLSHLKKKDKDTRPLKPTGVTYKFIIPNDYVAKFGLCLITEDNVRGFIAWADNCFKDELFVWMESRLSMKEECDVRVKTKNSILSFCKSYGITEDEFAYESLKKAVYRKFGTDKSPDIIKNKAILAGNVPQYL